MSKTGKGSKLFTLRRLGTEELMSCDEIKHAILDQLQDNAVDDFDIGLIVQGLCAFRCLTETPILVVPRCKLEVGHADTVIV